MQETCGHILESLFEGLATTTGRAFLDRLVALAVELCDAESARVAVIDPQHPNQLQVLASAGNSGTGQDTTPPIADSAAEAVLDSRATCLFASGVASRFPRDGTLKTADWYAGTPLVGGTGELLGLTSLQGRGNGETRLPALKALALIADRVSAEIERLDAEAAQGEFAARLKACQRRLDQSNHELEALSHAVSHDLRAPLRAVAGFSETLLQDYADRLDETGAQYLRRIQINGQRMQTLLDLLLQYARVLRQPLSPSRVDLSQLCETCLAQLRQRDAHRCVSISIQPGLRARCDAALMHQVLRALFDNAWKFTARTTPACISFSMIREAGETVYCLADNGAGFDMAYYDKLFELFQRLHGQSDFAAAPGAGLALAKRIVERHGGRIWATAAPGEGARFYFTLGAPANTTPPGTTDGL